MVVHRVHFSEFSGGQCMQQGLQVRFVFLPNMGRGVVGVSQQCWSISIVAWPGRQWDAWGFCTNDQARVLPAAIPFQIRPATPELGL